MGTFRQTAAGQRAPQFFALRTELLQTDFWKKKQLFQKETMECVIFELKNIQSGDGAQKKYEMALKKHTLLRQHEAW